jgi:hypothetical protein
VFNERAMALYRRAGFVTTADDGSSADDPQRLVPMRLTTDRRQARATRSR